MGNARIHPEGDSVLKSAQLRHFEKLNHLSNLLP